MGYNYCETSITDANKDYGQIALVATVWGEIMFCDTISSTSLGVMYVPIYFIIAPMLSRLAHKSSSQRMFARLHDYTSERHLKHWSCRPILCYVCALQLTQVSWFHCRCTTYFLYVYCFEKISIQYTIAFALFSCLGFADHRIRADFTVIRQIPAQ